MPLANASGAARDFYDARRAARLVHERGLYLVGRIVVFEDPILARSPPGPGRAPDQDGSVWRDGAGLGWTNPYDRRVWKYNVDVAAAAAKAGFDEILFDYVRFPSDGDVSCGPVRKSAESREVEGDSGFPALRTWSPRSHGRARLRGGVRALGDP